MKLYINPYIWEVSQKEKTNYILMCDIQSYINPCIWNLDNWYYGTYLQGRNRDADGKNGCGHAGRCGDKWESGTDTDTLYVRQTARGKWAVHHGELSSVLCDDLEMGWVRGKLKRKEEYVSLQLVHVIVQHKPMHCKAIIFQLKEI